MVTCILKTHLVEAEFKFVLEESIPESVQISGTIKMRQLSAVS